MMNRLRLVAVLALSVAAQQGSANDDRPNIIVILADDMGFSDIGCYGSEIDTPVLDQLAQNGLRFTQFYNTARCCPTRASLLTGLYPHQAGIGWMMTDRNHPGYRGDLNSTCRTMAEVLGPAGNGTYAVGKWHVTPYVKPGESKHNWPLQRGFDRFYGTIHGAGSFYDPNSLTRDNELISPFDDPEYKPETYYYTDAISDHAVRFIREHWNNPRAEAIGPLFMYVTYTAAHWPMHALPEDIEKYKGRYNDGYGAIRQERLRRMRHMGLIDESWEMSEQAEDWESVKHLDWEIRNMEVYAAMVDRMDQGIGKIVSALKQERQLENTLIFYLEDNGGCAEGMGRGSKETQARTDRPTLPPMKPGELQLDMIPKQTRDGYPVLQGPSVMPGPADTYIGYGRGWANVSNTPFREYKHWVHEGGISTPLIAHWPNGIQRRGELEHQPGHLIDIMATCVDLGQAEYPNVVHERQITPLEGRSLRPAFKGHTIEREAIYWEHEGNRAIRVGDWKLVARENKSWELYNMKEDRTEQQNLAAEQPDLVKKLDKQWTEWAERAHVLPLGTWRGTPKNTSYNRKQKRFELKADADLNREEAPFVVKKPFSLSVTIKAPGTDGVLVAHGGDAHGYAFYVKDSRLYFVTCVNGKVHEVTSKSARLDGTGALRVKVNAGGKVTIRDEDRVLAEGKIPPLASMPADGLQVGRDAKGSVGDYDGPFPFNGQIENVIVEVGPFKKN